MKKLHRIVALLLAVLMAFGLMTTAFAATDSAPTIDPRKKASLSIYRCRRFPQSLFSVSL